MHARRRALRILPAYWVALTGLALWPGLPGVFSAYWWIFYGLLQAYWYPTIHLGLAVAWSLTIEVAFYVVLPVLAALLGRLGRAVSPRERMRRQLFALAGLGVAAEMLRVGLFVIDRRDLNFTLPSMFLPFAVGMALAVASAWLGTDERRWRWTRFVVDRPGACWAGAALAFVATCFTPVFGRTGLSQHTALTWGLEQLVFVVVSALLLLPAIFGEEAGGWPRRLLATRALGFVGMVSYGIFLWHLPLLEWLAATPLSGWVPGAPFASMLGVGLAVSIPMGWLSYRCVEWPAMRLRSEPYRRVAPSPSSAASPSPPSAASPSPSSAASPSSSAAASSSASPSRATPPPSSSR